MNIAENLIKRSQITLSDPRQFNDPFDTMPVTSLTGTVAQFESYYRRIARRFSAQLSPDAHEKFIESAKKMWLDPRSRQDSAEKLTQKIRDGQLDSGIYCLSETFDHVLMWSHYADNHRGILVRFSLDPVKINSFAALALPVIYQKERPELEILTDDEESSLIKSMLTKADYWSYEKEWRLIFPNHPPGLYQISEEVIDGVFLGAKCPLEHQMKVCDWAARRVSPVDFFRAELDPRSFRLRFRQLKIGV